MSGALYVNDIDTITVGAVPTDLGGVFATPQRQVQVFSPNGTDVSFPSATSSAPPREWVVPFFLDEETNNQRRSSLSAFRRLFRVQAADADLLRKPCGNREVELRLSDSDLVLYAEYLDDDASLYEKRSVDVKGIANVPVRLMVYDSAWYSQTVSQVTINNTPQKIDLGDQPSAWDNTIAATVTAPEIIFYRDNAGSQGAELFRLSLAGTLSSGSWTVDGVYGRILHSVDGNVTTTVLPLAAGYFRKLGSLGETAIWVRQTQGSGTFRWRNRF